MQILLLLRTTTYCVDEHSLLSPGYPTRFFTTKKYIVRTLPMYSSTVKQSSLTENNNNCKTLSNLGSCNRSFLGKEEEREARERKRRGEREEAEGMVVPKKICLCFLYCSPSFCHLRSKGKLGRGEGGDTAYLSFSILFSPPERKGGGRAWPPKADVSTYYPFLVRPPPSPSIFLTSVRATVKFPTFSFFLSCFLKSLYLRGSGTPGEECK